MLPPDAASGGLVQNGMSDEGELSVTLLLLKLSFLAVKQAWPL